MTSFAVGQRVRAADDRAKGTIRYVGEVQGSSGEWLGVEWDDPSRGRHDGAINDKRYFQCQFETAGSFIRPRRCLHSVTFLQAVKDKYTTSLEECERFLIGKNSDAKGEFKIPVNFVGEDLVVAQQSQLEKLACISVKGMEVSTVEPNIFGILKNLQEVDLEDNLLTNWEEVYRLLPNVVELRLGKNKLCPTIPNPIFSNGPEVSSKLLKLVLNSVENAWSHVCEFAKHGCLTSLTELYLGDNGIERFDDVPKNGLNRLTLLDLTGNCIADWNMLTPLSFLPSLCTLVLDKNLLESIGPVDSNCFPKLHSLSLFGNHLSSFNCFKDLQVLSSLKSLRVQNNPIEDQIGPRLLRGLLIGLLPNLDTLNRSEITTRERNNSEFEFLRFCQPETSSFHRCSRHLELLSKFDHVIVGRSVDNTLAPGQPTTLSLKIRSNLASSMTMAPAIRNVLQSMSLDLVAQLARRHFKITEPADLDLYYHDPDSGFPILLEDWSKSLEFYAVRSGGEIIVESKGKSIIK